MAQLEIFLGYGLEMFAFLVPEMRFSVPTTRFFTMTPLVSVFQEMVGEREEVLHPKTMTSSKSILLPGSQLLTGLFPERVMMSTGTVFLTTTLTIQYPEYILIL